MPSARCRAAPLRARRQRGRRHALVAAERRRGDAGAIVGCELRRPVSAVDGRRRGAAGLAVGRRGHGAGLAVAAAAEDRRSPSARRLRRDRLASRRRSRIVVDAHAAPDGRGPGRSRLVVLPLRSLEAAQGAAAATGTPSPSFKAGAQIAGLPPSPRMRLARNAYRRRRAGHYRLPRGRRPRAIGRRGTSSQRRSRRPPSGRTRRRATSDAVASGTRARRWRHGDAAAAAFAAATGPARRRPVVSGIGDGELAAALDHALRRRAARWAPRGLGTAPVLGAEQLPR